MCVPSARYRLSPARERQTGGVHTHLLRSLSSPASVARELARDVLACIWPVSCIGCRAEDRELCADCARRLLGETVHTVSGADEARGPWFVAGAYDGIRRTAIVRFKHGGSLGLAHQLGRSLARALGTALDDLRARGCAETDTHLLVPVPSRPARVRERGFRHLELLLRHAVRRLSGERVIVVPRVLLATRGRTGQVGLSAAERRANAKKLRLRRRSREALRGAHVILIDDVITTGATLTAAEAVLTRAGATVCTAVALAAARSRRRRPVETGMSKRDNGLAETPGDAVMFDKGDGQGSPSAWGTTPFHKRRSPWT